MTRIDFYILPEGGGPGGSPVMTACKLCDKATAGGHRVYAHVPDPVTAEDLDGALWSFQQGGFLAHERYDGEPLDEPLPSVLIGAVEPPETHHGVMLNLGLEVPDWFSRFERVLEIVAADAEGRAKSRERYKFYRDRGYELATHKL
ncbi:MAG TPA: DNA polymerase III subunit chi [Solimonas sp.]